MKLVLSGVVMVIALAFSTVTFAQTSPPVGSTGTAGTATDQGKAKTAKKDKKKEAAQHSNKGGELRGLGRERLDQRSAPAVDDLRQTIGLLLHIGDDLVGLAGHRRAEIAAGGENRTFDVGRGRLDLRADFVRRGDQRALCILRRGLDVVGGLCRDRTERTLDVGGDRRDMARRFGRCGCKRTLGFARAAQDRGGGIGANGSVATTLNGAAVCSAVSSRTLVESE